MEKNFILNRRTVLGGAAALGTVGVLAACGSSKDSKATTKGATVGTCLLYTSIQAVLRGESAQCGFGGSVTGYIR